jgi:hypothetical protein
MATIDTAPRLELVVTPNQDGRHLDRDAAARVSDLLAALGADSDDEGLRAKRRNLTSAFAAHKIPAGGEANRS